MTEPTPASGTPASARRSRAPQTVQQRLAALILLLEVGLIFFAALVTFGLRYLPPWAALGGGALLGLVFLFGASAVRRPWGITFGWALQVVLILTGFANPLMFVLGAVFAALYGYGVIRAGRLPNGGTDPETDPRPGDDA